VLHIRNTNICTQQTLRHKGSRKIVLSAGRNVPQGNSFGTHFSWRLSGQKKYVTWKFPRTLRGIQTGTSLLAMKCLKQLRQRPPHKLMYDL
jgi:hypothetical protein